MSSSPRDASSNKTLSKSEKRAAVRFANEDRKPSTDKEEERADKNNFEGKVSNKRLCKRPKSNSLNPNSGNNPLLRGSQPIISRSPVP